MKSLAARLTGIEKSFGTIRALDQASLEIWTGEVGAVLGENGAGKTTLLKVLAGLVRPDAGSIEIRGETVRLRNRRDAIQRGVGFVQQSLTLIDELTILENYLLGRPASGTGLRASEAMRELETQASSLGLQLDPRARVSELAMGERQRAEIVTTLSEGAQILILDEPTSSLGEHEFDVLAPIIRKLAEQGTAIVYISHRLREVRAIADRVTVMRRGKVVATHHRDEAGERDLIEEMIGRVPPKLAGGPSETGGPVVRLEGVTTSGRGHRGSHLRDVSLVVHRGEVLGVAAVAGNGETELAGVLAGILEPTSGRVVRDVQRTAFIPEDRVALGVAAMMSVSDNAIVRRHRALARRGWIDRRGVASYVGSLLARFRVVAPSLASPVSALSGGNQQKLVLGRELDEGPDLIVAHNPARGLDVAASQDVKERLLAAAVAGAAVVFISPDLDELFEVSDRLVVLYEGRVVATLDPSTTTPKDVASLMAGVS